MSKIIDTASRLYDGLQNIMSGLGTSVDGNANGSGWFMRPISQAEIEASFRTSWLSRKVHTIPVTDQVRPWRAWNATPDQITAIEAEERRLGLRQKVRKALLWSRLFGGAAIIMGVEGDDPRLPLDVTKVKKAGLSYIHVLSRHEITISQINLDPGSMSYGEPLVYNVNTGGSLFPIHPSRVVRFTNSDLPDNITFSEQGWSDPLLVSIRDVLVNADGAQGNFAALTSKARTSTLSTPGLTNIISTKDGEANFIKKTRMVKQFESLFHLNIVSGPSKTGEEGEKWTNEVFSFANIPEMGTWFIQMVAGAADVPMTRLSGMSPGGMNSTGDSDTANYWTMLDAGRELDLRPRLEMIDEVLIRSATGARDPAIWFNFLPFEVDTEATRAANAKLRAEAINTLSQSSTVPSEVLAKAVKGLLIDGGEYPGIEDAYSEWEASGGDLAEINPPAEPANDKLLAAATEGGVAAGKSASVAAADARALLTDASPMTLYISRAVLNFPAIRSHFEDQGVTVTVPDDKAHVTVAFSRQPIDWLTVSPDDWGATDGGLKIQPGGPRLMDVFNGTLVQVFGSSQLSWRHEAILRAGATWDHPDYNPHFSLDYSFTGVSVEDIKPWVGPIDLGPERFAEVDENWSDDD